MNIKVCMFDDNPQVRDSFETLLGMMDGIELCATFYDAIDVVKKVKSCNANVVIMDIDMPVANGISAVKELRRGIPDISIIMFTVFEDGDKIFESVCAGANGYLLKKTEPLKVIEAIREVVEGGSPMSLNIARKILNKFQSMNSTDQNQSYELTAREKEILKLLTQGLSYKMIAARCEISFETVRTHIKNIYSKLHVASMTEAVAKAINERLV